MIGNCDRQMKKRSLNRLLNNTQDQEQGVVGDSTLGYRNLGRQYTLAWLKGGGSVRSYFGYENNDDIHIHAMPFGGDGIELQSMRLVFRETSAPAETGSTTECGEGCKGLSDGSDGSQEG